MLSIVVNILLFIFVIGFLTFVHELGHFLVAKAIKAKVYEFSLGFGPKLISKKYKGTLYCIRVIPLGGFVKILGDGDPGDYEKGENLSRSKNNLNNKPKLLQIAVMLAGVSMNVIFAILFYYIVLGSSNWKTSPIYVDLENINIVGARVEKIVGYEAIPEGNADLAGLPTFGVIKEIDGKEVNNVIDISEGIKGKNSVVLLACNESLADCREYTVEVDEESKIWVFVSHGYIMDYNQTRLTAGGAYVINNLKIIGKVLGSMIGDAKETGDYTELSNTVSGPIGIFLLIDYIKTKGIIIFLSLIADLSLSLAIMNLLPIPALDGGRIFILLIEGIFRRDLDERVEAIIINISMGFLIILIVLVMIKDVVNIDNIRNMFG